MKTYLNYKNKINGYIEVKDTIKTIEKISAVNIHLLKEKLINLNKYINEIENVLSQIYPFCNNFSNPFLEKLSKRKKQKRSLLIITGEKGLVGNLWHNLIGILLQKKKLYHYIIVCGKKGALYAKEEGIKFHKFFNLNSGLEEAEINDIVNFIFYKFKKREISSCDILYPHFVSLTKQEPEILPFLPFNLIYLPKTNRSLGFPIFEPNKEKLFNFLLEKYIIAIFYKIIFESKLSEFSARTVNTENASEKTKHLITTLYLKYFKERRTNITKKQLESFIVHKLKL